MTSDKHYQMGRLGFAGIAFKTCRPYCHEPGWYAFDDGGKVVLGPFVSLAECERAMRDRKRMTGA
jgi:hypothetical protein